MKYCPRYHECDPVLMHIEEMEKRFGGDYEMTDYEWFYTAELAEARDDYYENLPFYLYEESVYELLFKEHAIDGEDSYNAYDARMALKKPFKIWHSSMWSVRHGIREHWKHKNGMVTS